MIRLEVSPLQHLEVVNGMGLMVDYVVQSIITSTTPEDRSRVIAAFKGHLQDSTPILNPGIVRDGLISSGPT
jgi:hypothetical protein